MKTKKILWGLLITIIMIGCSADDSHIMQEQVDINAKNFDVIYTGDILNPPVYVIPEDRGMPAERHSVYEDGILKIVYPHHFEEHQRFYVRKEFSEKYPSLRYVLVTNSNLLIRTHEEYWFLGEVDGNSIYDDTNLVVDREEDEELNGDPKYISLYQSVINDIVNHNVISLFFEYHP